MDYQRALAWLNSHQRMGIVFGLDNTTDLLAFLGDPHKRLRSVHVAGTNGKGSVCAMISSVLREEGYRVGLYTSPHLVELRERIQINGNIILENEMAEIITRIREACESLIERSPGREFTFFEITTVLAFAYFARRKVEMAVIEVGMGGRLDATNVIQPECSVISCISLEHTRYLGNSITQIAEEKAGIIKNRSPVIAIDQSDDALGVFQKVARQREAPITIVGRDIEFHLLSSTLDGTEVEVQGIENPIFVPLVGSYQASNAALACAALLQLMNGGLYISEGALHRGMSKVEWPGRMETISRAPTVIFDVSHTPDGARVVSQEICRLLKDKVILVMGVLDDKDLPSICSYFGPVARMAFAVAPDTKRAYPPDVVASELRHYLKDVEEKESVAEALKSALSTMSSTDTVLVTGSFYTVGEAKRWWDERKAGKWDLGQDF